MEGVGEMPPPPPRLLSLDSDSNTKAKAERSQASGKRLPSSSACRCSGANSGRIRGAPETNTVAGIRVRQHPAPVGTPALRNGEACSLPQKKRKRFALLYAHTRPENIVFQVWSRIPNTARKSGSGVRYLSEVVLGFALRHLRPSATSFR